MRLTSVGPQVQFEIPKLVERLPYITGNNAIIDSPCISQFYLLKLVTGSQ